MVVSSDIMHTMSLVVAGVAAFHLLKARVRVLEFRADEAAKDIGGLRSDVEELRAKHLEVLTEIHETNQRLAVLTQKFEDIL